MAISSSNQSFHHLSTLLVRTNWWSWQSVLFFSSLEQITVGYDPATYVTTESDRSVTLTVRVFSHPGGAPQSFTLVVNTEDGTASMFQAAKHLPIELLYFMQLLIMYQWLVRLYSSMREISLRHILLPSMMIMIVRRIQMKISSPTLSWTEAFLMSLWLCLKLQSLLTILVK